MSMMTCKKEKFSQGKEVKVIEKSGDRFGRKHNHHEHLMAATERGCQQNEKGYKRYYKKERTAKSRRSG